MLMTSRYASNFRKFCLCVWSLVFGIAGTTFAFHGADRIDAVGNGNWSEESTWESEDGNTEVVPTEDSEAGIGNGFEVTIDGDVGNIHNFRIGAVPLTTGTLNMIDGGFLIAERGYAGGGGGFVKEQSMDLDNGDLLGVLNISGGELQIGPLFVGAEFENRGVLNMSGGELSTTESLWVSRAGHGVINQTGGTINVGGALIMHEACCGVNIPEAQDGNPDADGRLTESTGIYNMSGGELNIPEHFFQVGQMGTKSRSEMNLSGGIVTAKSMRFMNDNGTDLFNLSKVGVLRTELILDLSGELEAEEVIEIGYITGVNLQVEDGENDTMVIRNPGDPNANGVADASDIDALTLEINNGTHDLSFDLTDDDLIDQNDHRVWVEEVATTYYGDSNLDGAFDDQDFVSVFIAGKYLTGQEAGWAEGDWNGDLLFTEADFVSAFIAGGYLQGTRGAASTVPEPSSLLLLALGMLGLVRHRR